MARNYTHPDDLLEVFSLRREGYTVENPQPGVYLLDGWLFIWPKRQRWGERYKNVFGSYRRGHLAEFVAGAYQGNFSGQDPARPTRHVRQVQR